MNPLVIFGAGDIAEIAEYYFRTDSGRKIAAFTVDGGFLKESRFREYPLVPFEDVCRAFPPPDFDLFVAVSYTQLNALRARKMAEAESKGYSLASYVSSASYIWNGFVANANIFVLEDNTLQPFCKVGRGTTLWSGNHIGHHSVVEDNCFVSSHVVVSGGVTIGEQSFIGVNATIRDHIRIGKRNVIGAGSLIVGDTPDDAVYTAPKAEMSPVPSSRLRQI